MNIGKKFEEFWLAEENSEDDYDDMKDFAKTYWDAAIKYLKENSKLPDMHSVLCDVEKWFDKKKELGMPSPADVVRVTYNIISGKIMCHDEKNELKGE